MGESNIEAALVVQDVHPELYQKKKKPNQTQIWPLYPNLD